MQSVSEADISPVNEAISMPCFDLAQQQQAVLFEHLAKFRETGQHHKFALHQRSLDVCISEVLPTHCA